LAKGAETSISMALLVMFGEKIRRLLRIIFVTIFAWVYAWQWPGCLWMALRTIGLLETTESLVIGYPCRSAAYAMVLSCNPASLRFVFVQAFLGDGRR
jgi:hypothetical protein